MPSIPTRTIDFKHSNGWGVNDGTSELMLSRPQLLHAAITVGHRGMRGRRAMLEEDDWQAEIMRKVATFDGIVKEGKIVQGRCAFNRLLPRKSLATLDPSEKSILSYQFGMTMATAWARKVLGVPWLLHLDVYFEALNMPRTTGKRADMIGRHPAGSWVVVEAKGYKKKPTRKQQSDAKVQARQIANVGGSMPALNVAVISFFSPIPSSAKSPVAHLWAIDPAPEESDPGYSMLADLTSQEFFRLYYEQWASVFRVEDFRNQGRLRPRSNFLWKYVPDAGLRVGILPEMLEAFEMQQFSLIPELIKEAASRSDGPATHPAWVGDGIVIELMSR